MEQWRQIRSSGTHVTGLSPAFTALTYSPHSSRSLHDPYSAPVRPVPSLLVLW